MSQTICEACHSHTSMKPPESPAFHKTLERIADALERLAPPPPCWTMPEHMRYVRYDASQVRFLPVENVQPMPLEVLHGIEPQKEALLINTTRFASGKPANHALLWGARGTGKSSLVLSVVADVAKQHPALTLIGIDRQGLAALPAVLNALQPYDTKRFILLCDDLSFEAGEAAYKHLKPVLEGGLLGQLAHVLCYATSNRRHLMGRSITENTENGDIHPAETADEHISLSDRFGLSLGFHMLLQAEYLEIVHGYLRYYGVPETLHDGLLKESLAWAVGRGNRSGRTAHQFVLSCC